MTPAYRRKIALDVEAQRDIVRHGGKETHLLVVAAGQTLYRFCVGQLHCLGLSLAMGYA
jgi:hypothetical protein